MIRSSVFSDFINPKKVIKINSPFYLSTNLIEDFEVLGIPNEISEKVFIDYPFKILPWITEFNDPLKIIYIPDQYVGWEIKNELSIIAIFNQLVTINFTIICEEEYIELLKQYSNQNISFLSKVEVANGKIKLNTHIIITHGSGVIHFLKQQIPVIIAGPYGFGGWVTSQNISYLIKKGFSGRSGGTFGEMIPVELLAHEVLAIKESKNLQFNLKEVKKIADKLPYKPLSKAIEIIERFDNRKAQWEHHSNRWRLKPFIASNILFKEAGETIMVTRKYIHDTLCTISQEDLPFFQRINGEITCKELFKDSGLEENEFWEILYSLNEQKIILY